MAIIVAMEDIYDDVVDETTDETRGILGLFSEQNTDGEEEVAFIGEEETPVSDDDIAESEDTEVVSAMAQSLESLIDTQTQQLTSSLEAYGIAMDIANPNLTEYQRHKRVHALEGYSTYIGSVAGLESNDEKKPGILKRIWEWFKKTMASIKEMFKNAWTWFINLFNKEEKKAKAMIQYIKTNVDKVEVAEEGETADKREVVEEVVTEKPFKEQKPVKEDKLNNAVDKASLTITLPKAQLRHLFLSSQRPLKVNEDDRVAAVEFLEAIKRTAKVMGDNVEVAVKDTTTDKLINHLSRLTGDVEDIVDMVKGSKLKQLVSETPKYQEASLPNGKRLSKLSVEESSADKVFQPSKIKQLSSQIEQAQFIVENDDKAETIQDSITIQFNQVQLLSLVKSLEEVVIYLSRFKAVIAKANKQVQDLDKVSGNLAKLNLNKVKEEGGAVYLATIEGIKTLINTSIYRIKNPVFDLQHLSMNFFLTLLRIVNTFGFKIKQQLDKSGNIRVFTP